MFEHINITLVYKLCILVTSLFCLLKFSFLKKSGNKEVFVSFFLFGFSVFFVTYFLSSIEISMGFAFGLFAIFSVLRYRTESLGARDMTYLFTTITLSLITSVSALGVAELALICLVICSFAMLLESELFSEEQQEKEIIYEVIENIKPENHEILLADLKDRTGLDIISIRVNDINFINDSAKLTVKYRGEKSEKKLMPLFSKGYRKSLSS